MKRVILGFIFFPLWSSLAFAQQDYKMAGPYEVVARDGQYAKTKGGSERDMYTAMEYAKTYSFVSATVTAQKQKDTALEIINAYAKTLQRFDGHDAPLCTIQAYWLVRAMIMMKEYQTPEWNPACNGKVRG